MWRSTGRLWSSELRDTLGGRNRASLKMHLEAVIEQVWWCTWRPTSSNSKMHLEAVMERVWRSTWRLCLSEFRDAFGGRDQVTQRCTWRPRTCWTLWCTWRLWLSEIGDAFGGRDGVTTRCIWRPWSSEFGDPLGGHDWGRLRKYMRAVDRWRTGCWKSIHPSANLQPWGCDEVTVHLSSYGELAGGGQSCKEAHRKLKLHSGVNSWSWEWREARQS